jgi:[ribosomal protein S5]-alanine N-acetyltransferase
MQNDYATARLSLSKLQLSDSIFIQQLVNTEGWIQFIGDRNIHTEEAAIAYIEKLLNSAHITYWVVRLKEDPIPIGVVTLIKRDYLDHYDIGFAFLPEYGRKGYAFEAATAILEAVTQYPQHTKILATTLKNNNSSIQLLQKLGFHFEKEIERDNEKLLVFAFVKQSAPL